MQSVTADDVQRVFLQAIFSRSIVSTKLAQTLWEKSIDAVNVANPELRIPKHAGREAWDAFVTKINKSLDKLDLDFRHLTDENSGIEMYAMVNRKGDEIAHIATEYSPNEIKFFKTMIEMIMLAPRRAFSVSSTVALRDVSKMNMTKTHAEHILGSFVAKGWLSKSKRGRYSLSTRSLLELGPYINTTYTDEIIECTICSEIITRGVTCPNTPCKAAMHYHCFSTYRRRQKACPSCREDWPENYTDKTFVPIGENAAKEGDEDKRWSRNENSDEEGFYDEDEPEASQSQSQSQSRSQPKAQRSQRATRKAKIVHDDSMDVEDED